MFTSYLNNFETAVNLNAELQSTIPSYKEFVQVSLTHSSIALRKTRIRATNNLTHSFISHLLRSTQHAQADPRCKMMDLNSFLITPVQRVPRYKLLLEELLKRTPETEPDFQTLKEAFELTKNSAKHNNEMIRQKEMSEKMVTILASFAEGTKLMVNKKVFDLIDPTRSFVREGFLDKLCRRGPKPFMFWLFSDLLIYGEASNVSSKFKIHRVIQLSRCQITAPSDDNSAPAQAEDGTNIELPVNCMISVESDQKSFLVFAETKIIRDQWIKAINDTMQLNREKFEAETGKLAPAWRPDASASACTCCGKKFTMLIRKHHCRNCGLVVCGSCSGTRVLLPHIDEAYKVRICGSCVDGGIGKQKQKGDVKFVMDDGAQILNEKSPIEVLQLDVKVELDLPCYPAPQPKSYGTKEDDFPPIWAKMKPLVGNMIAKEEEKRERKIAEVINNQMKDADLDMAGNLALDLKSLEGVLLSDLVGLPLAPPPSAAPPSLVIDGPVVPPPSAAPPLVVAGTGAPVKPSKPGKPVKPIKQPIIVEQNETETPKGNVNVTTPAVPPRPSRFKNSQAPPAELVAAANFTVNTGQYSYEQLIVPKNDLPKDVDSSMREKWLSDAAFMTCFGCTRATWRGYPNWKKIEFRKAAKLW